MDLGLAAQTRSLECYSQQFDPCPSHTIFLSTINSTRSPVVYSGWPGELESVSYSDPTRLRIASAFFGKE